MKRNYERTQLLIWLYLEGDTYQQIADTYGGTANGVRSNIRRLIEAGLVQPRHKKRWTPKRFADACRRIVAEQRGHDAHRSLDFLTNDVLREYGLGEGIDIFEAAVAKWHREADPYPYQGPCPDCEREKS